MFKMLLVSHCISLDIITNNFVQYCKEYLAQPTIAWVESAPWLHG